MSRHLIHPYEARIGSGTLPITPKRDTMDKKKETNLRKRKNVHTKLLLFLLQLFSKCSLHKTQTDPSPLMLAILPHKDSEQDWMT